MASKAPVLRKGLTFEEFIKNTWLESVKAGRNLGSDRIGQKLAFVAAEVAVKVLLDAVDKGERITKGEMLYFHTQLGQILNNIGHCASASMSHGELQPTILDKMVQ